MNLQMMKVFTESILHSVRLLMASQNHDWEMSMDHLSVIEKDAIKLQTEIERQLASKSLGRA